LNNVIDTIPNDVDKHAFDLRKRNAGKEIAHGTIRLKSFSTIEKLNDLYVNDTRILDCELLSANPKKRFTVPEA